MPEDEKEKLLESVRKDIKVPENRGMDYFSYFVIGLFIAVFVSLIVVLGLEKAKANKLEALEKEINNEVTIPLNSLAKEKKQIDLVSKQLEVLSTALSGRIKYSQILDDLRNGQYKQSLWTSFTIQQDKISIQGSASDFESVGKTVAAFRQIKSVKDVSLKSVTVNNETNAVDFSVTIQFNPSLYKYLPQTQASSSSGGQE